MLTGDKDIHTYLQRLHIWVHSSLLGAHKKISNKTKKLIKNIMMGLLFQFYVCLRYYVDLSIDFLFGWYFDKQRKYIPNAKDLLILESASSIARKIRERKVKAEDVVRTYIERVKQVNGILNAVVDERFTDALQEARKIDQDIESGKITEEDFKKRPFLGVPFTTKESTSCKGLKYSMGLRCRKDILGKEDAKVISLMKRAGGILIGVTNVPQINLWTESYNPVYGTTNNPYNTTRNVGGSSGGEASILAAGGSPIGIGGDIGGSLRIPSFRCGVFAHKCSPELLSFHGLGFRTGDELPSMVVPGPMTRYAEDLIPLFKVLLDDKVIKLRLDDEVNIEKLNVFYSLSMHCPFASPIHNNIKECVRKVVNHFSKISEIKPQEVHFEKTRYAVRLWSYKMTQEQNDYRADICDRRGKASLPSELVKTVLRCSEYNLYVIYNLINELLPKAPRDWAEKTIRELKDEITAKLGDNGVLLFPSEPFTASYHYTSLLRPWNMSYYALWNALNLPVTQVPLGLSEDGLPLGIQVIAAPYCDHLCIAMAKELEKAFGGYVPPFELEK